MLSRVTRALRAHRANPKSLSCIFSESFWDKCWKGSADREHLQAPATAGGCHEIGQELWKRHPHLAALITQHSVPSQIKRDKLHIFKFAFTISNYISDINSFQSFNHCTHPCAYGHRMSWHHCPGLHAGTWSELLCPAQLSHARQARANPASHRAALLFKNTKFHKKRVAANFCSFTSNKTLPGNYQITPLLPILNSAFKFLYKNLIYTGIFYSLY